MKKTFSPRANPFFDLVVDNCECDDWWKFSSPPKVNTPKIAQQEITKDVFKARKKRNNGDSMRIGCLMGEFDEKKVPRTNNKKYSFFNLSHQTNHQQKESRFKKIKEVRNNIEKNVYDEDDEDIFLDARDFTDQEEIFYDLENQNEMNYNRDNVVTELATSKPIQETKPLVSTHQPLNTPPSHSKSIKTKSEKNKSGETKKKETKLNKPKTTETKKLTIPTNIEAKEPKKTINTQKTNSEKAVDMTNDLTRDTTCDSIPVPVFSSTFIDISPEIETYHIIPKSPPINNPDDIKMDVTITQQQAEMPISLVTTTATTSTISATTNMTTTSTTTTTSATTNMTTLTASPTTSVTTSEITLPTTITSSTTTISSTPTTPLTTTIPLTTSKLPNTTTPLTTTTFSSSTTPSITTTISDTTSTTTSSATTTTTTNSATTTAPTGWPSAIFCDYEKPKFLKIFEPSEPWYLFGDEVVEVASPPLQSDEVSEVSDDPYSNSSSLFNVVKNTKHKTSHHYDHFSYMKKTPRVEGESSNTQPSVLKEKNSKKDAKVRFEINERMNSNKIDDTLKENLQEFRKEMILNNYKDADEDTVKTVGKKKKKETKEARDWKKQNRDAGKYGDINGGIFTDESEEWYTHVHNELDLNKCISLENDDIEFTSDTSCERMSVSDDEEVTHPLQQSSVTDWLKSYNDKKTPDKRQEEQSTQIDRRIFLNAEKLAQRQRMASDCWFDQESNLKWPHNQPIVYKGSPEVQKIRSKNQGEEMKGLLSPKSLKF